MLDNDKPHRGDIYHWRKVPFDQVKANALYGEDTGLGYYVDGFRVPDLKLGAYWRTSWVVKHEGDMIETRNSRYRLAGPEFVPNTP